MAAKLTPEQEVIAREEKLAMMAAIRKDGSAQLTPINYVYDDGVFLISTTRDRAKYHNVKRNPKVSLCIIRPEWRPYLTVYGTARVEEVDIVEGTAKIYRHMTGNANTPDGFADALKQQKRVLIILTPEQLSP